MFESESDDDGDQYVPAVLRRPKVANYSVHEAFTVDTRDHEDHTFCGVMFDITCRSARDGGVPLASLQVDSLSVRGHLGPITVWSTPESFKGKEHAPQCWELHYEKSHPPSLHEYQKLELEKPVRLSPGEKYGIYVHSKQPGDDAIVYDNQRGIVTYEDGALKVLPGIAHLSNRPFGRHGMWGYPWRERREFVGRVAYSVSYKLWNPEVHLDFPLNFRRTVRCILLCARRVTSPLHWLHDEVLFYILNMCRYDWFTAVSPQVTSAHGSGRDARALSAWAARGSVDRYSGHRGIYFATPGRDQSDMEEGDSDISISQLQSEEESSEQALEEDSEGCSSDSAL